MANLSRTEKYKELRERLQNDNDADIHAPELSEYESRLNRIDANNFAAPPNRQNDTARSEGAHARKEPSSASVNLQRDEDTGSYQNLSSNENYTAPSFDNDYLNRYIQEVKQYNIDQGNAVSDRTEVNIMNQLRNERPASRPYQRQIVQTDNDFEDTGDGNVVVSRKQPEPGKEQKVQEPAKADQSRSLDYTDQLRSSSQDRRYPQSYEDDFTNDLDFDDDVSETASSEPEDAATKEDIMAQVQDLVSGKRRQTAPPQPKKQQQDQDEGEDTRQQLINETSQMRAQLDDYGDNLSEVTDKMRHTNQILNLVLVVLIIALAVVLGVVIFWIMRG